MTITAPGIFTDVPEADYHADPCPEPSLSRSLAKTLATKTPRHGFLMHPRLDPNFQAKEGRDIFDLGTAGHSAVLGRGGEMVEAHFDDWRGAAAQSFKKQAREVGMIPLLSKDIERVNALKGAVFEQLPEHGLGHLFDPTKGAAEVVIAGVDSVAGWVRCMVDWLETDMTFWDVKITAIDMDDETIGRHCSSMGYEYQPAFYERVAATVQPSIQDNIRFGFLFIENKPPFQIVPIRLPNDALAKGRAMVAKGCEVWRDCKAAQSWPRHTATGLRTVDYPPWATAEFANYQEGNGE